MKNRDITEFAKWVPKKAKDALTSQNDQKMISEEELLYLSVLFTDKNLESFWHTIKNYDYTFFSRLYIHTYRSFRFFQASHAKRNKIPDIQDDLSCLEKDIKKVAKSVRRLQKNVDGNALNFKNFLSQIRDFKNTLTHEKHAILGSTENTNKFRPLSRQSFGAGRRPQANSYALSLHSFLTKERLTDVIDLEPIQIKEHTCSIINSLMDLRDDPLTPRDLDNTLRNFEKRSRKSS